MVSRELFGYKLRPQQAEILAYEGGRLAISAVPGSGKTLTLALLAAHLVTEGLIGDEAEVLVVTVQNSAVDNISTRIRDILRSEGLPPVGYRVSTLHKLASDIVHERQDLAGVEERFTIVDEAETARMLHNAADAWIASERAWWLSLLPEESQGSSSLEKYWRQETERIGREVAKLCKHLQLAPEEAWRRFREAGGDDPFCRIGLELYQRYTQYLHARSGLDFDDLIWRAIVALDRDTTFVAALRRRWPYVLEDEAQDSSPLQERILGTLVGQDGNWVRVGDPNQSINATFTAADPRYFRRFLDDQGRRISLSASGRSGQAIIELANYLVRWTCAEHPEATIRTTAFEPQDIEPVPEGDEQPNPPPEECTIYFADEPFADVTEQARRVAAWAVSYAQRHPNHTIAILCPAGWHGNEVVSALEEMGSPVPFQDLLRSTPKTRSVARILTAACRYLAAPTLRDRLATLYGTLAAESVLEEDLDQATLRRRRTVLRSLPPQELLFPRTAEEIAELLPPGVTLPGEGLAALTTFREMVARWVRAASLPVDQLLLTMAQELFQTESDLAICHAIASSLRSIAEMHPSWRLADFAAELEAIARNRQSLPGLSLADAGYRAQEGVIVITTMHKAKGLEWDTVYLMCVDSLEFPDTCADAFRDQPFFMPGRAPAVEARKRLENWLGAELAAGDEDPIIAARLEYIAERLRLLYVGITRARRNLAFTWSKTNGRQEVRPAGALLALRAYRLGCQAKESS